MAMGIDSLVEAKKNMYANNPEGLQKKAQLSGALLDALAMQKLVAEKQSAKNQIAMAMQNNPKTIVEQNEETAKKNSLNEVMEGVSGVLGQQENQRQQNLAQAGQPQQPQSAGIAGQPKPNMQGFARGGIVGYKKGKKIDPKNLSKTALERFLRAPLDSKFGRFLYNPPEEKEFNDVSDPIERANKLKDEAVYQTRRTDPSAGLDSIMQQSISGGGTLEDKARRLGVTVEQLRQAGLKSANLNKLIDPSVGGVSADNPRKMPGQINTDSLEMRPSFNKNLQSTDQITSPKPAVEPFEPNMRDRNMRVPGMTPPKPDGIPKEETGLPSVNPNSNYEAEMDRLMAVLSAGYGNFGKANARYKQATKQAAINAEQRDIDNEVSRTDLDIKKEANRLKDTYYKELIRERGINNANKELTKLTTTYQEGLESSPAYSLVREAQARFRVLEEDSTIGPFEIGREGKLRAQQEKINAAINYAQQQYAAGEGKEITTRLAALKATLAEYEGNSGFTVKR